MAVREIGRNDEWRDVASAATAAPMPAPSTQPSTGSLFPWQTPAAPTPAPTASTAAGNQSMKQCGAQWQAAKAAGTTGGATWPQFLKSCWAQLASTTSAPPQADLCQRLLQHRLPRLRQCRRNPVHCFRGSGRQLHRLEAPRRPEADLRRRRKLSIVVPDQRSFGSMSIRTSTISLEHAITATRKAGLICARRRLRLQVIAQR
jgi:hypothetical protein